jgi:hypothetical protein
MTRTPRPKWKSWSIVLLFGLAFLVPMGYAAHFLITAGFKPDVVVYILGLSVPSLLIPTLPRSLKKSILSSGWPARLAFGLPGILTGFILLQFTIFDVGRIPYLESILMIFFSGTLMLLGILLLIPHVYSND